MGAVCTTQAAPAVAVAANAHAPDGRPASRAQSERSSSSSKSAPHSLKSTKSAHSGRVQPEPDSRDTAMAVRRSHEIDAQLRRDAAEVVVKLLLLGPGECGKSTILKQMRLLHTQGFTDQEIEVAAKVVKANIMHGLYSIIVVCVAEGNGRHANGTMILQNEDFAQHLLTAWESGRSESEDDLDVISAANVRALTAMWREPAVQGVYANRSKYGISDALKYFMCKLPDVASASYRPSTQDMLMCRLPTVGVSTVQFVARGTTFNVFDVGGQRSERRKWIHCFDNVNAVIFIAAISEFDMVMVEKKDENRMVDTMRLFDQICNSMFFVKTSMILFLNKIDLFREKIKRVPLNVLFDDYTGAGDDYAASVRFVCDKMRSLKEDPLKDLYVHETCATDTDQVAAIITSVTDSVINRNLTKFGAG